VNSRSELLKRYTGNWATFEILKTLLKNRRVYRNRIELHDNNDDDNAVDLKDSEGEGDVDLKDGNNLGGWDNILQDDTIDDIYQIDMNNEGNQSGDDNEDGNGKDFIGSDREVIGYKNEYKEDKELGGNDVEGRNGEGSCMSSAKQTGTKRKASQDDKPAPTATGAKKKKSNGSEGHPAATQSTKKILAKRSSRKKV
jgi:hypothetical protein